MKGFNTVKQMQREIKKINSGVASDTIFSAKTIYFIAKRIDELVKIQRKQHLSEFHYFMSYKIKVEGLPFNEALTQWKKRVEKES